MHHGPVSHGCAHMRDGCTRDVNHGLEINVEYLIPDAEIEIQNGSIAIKPNTPATLAR